MCCARHINVRYLPFASYGPGGGDFKSGYNAIKNDCVAVARQKLRRSLHYILFNLPCVTGPTSLHHVYIVDDLALFTVNRLDYQS